MSKNCVMIEIIYGNETLFNWFDHQIIFKKKDENEEYDQQSKLAQQYARLDPSALNSAMDESKHFQVKKDPFNSVWWQIFNFYWIKNDHSIVPNSFSLPTNNFSIFMLLDSVILSIYS